MPETPPRRLMQRVRARLHKSAGVLSQEWLRHRLLIWFDYLFFRKPQLRPVFILAMQRTGSNLLRDYLNSIPNVQLAGEILNPAVPAGIRKRFVSKAAALRHIRYWVNYCAGEISGAKLFLNQMRF